MGSKWSAQEETKYQKELFDLYVTKNMTIKEIGVSLGTAEQTIYKRLKRLNIPTQPEKKQNYRNQRHDVVLPTKKSDELAEFFGIMLGDGKLAPYQVIVTLGTKEHAYAKHVSQLITTIFAVTPKIGIRKTGYTDVYFGSVLASRWLREEGLVYNKVLSQVDIPDWIFTKKRYTTSFLRGFFDTDGSIYLLKFGIQISLTNYSLPLLSSLQKMLQILRYNPSAISSHKVYITKIPEIKRFFQEIQPANPKHQRRYEKFLNIASIG